MNIKIFGTKITISFYFFAFFMLLVLVDKSGYFLPISVAVIIHEAGHLLTMRLLGTAPKEIVLVPASVRIVRDICAKPSYEAAVSVSGPLANISFFAAFYVIYLFVPKNVFIDFAVINLLIGAFNLLPVNGLDGGVLLKKICAVFLGETKAQIVVNVCALILAVLLVFLGVKFIMGGRYNFTPILLSIYLLLSIFIKM